jgi:copper chaperone CopZ
MIEFHVPDMKTQECVAKVRGAVQSVDPDARCDIDLASGRVAFMSPLPPSDFVEALEEVGYKALLGPFG